MVAEEAPHVEPEPDRQFLPRQVSELPKLAGMNARRARTAAGTWRHWTGRLNAQRNPGSVCAEREELQLIGIGEDRRAWHACGPSTGTIAAGSRDLCRMPEPFIKSAEEPSTGATSIGVAVG